jgi:hypothetical protein
VSPRIRERRGDPTRRPPGFWASIAIGVICVTVGVLQLAGVISREWSDGRIRRSVGEGPIGPSIIIAAGIGIAVVGIARHLKLKRARAIRPPR